MPLGNWCWMVKSHSCTVCSLRLGSKAVMEGALESNCAGGVSCACGCVVGAGSALGKPCAMRTSGTDEQPGVVDPPTVAEQLNTRPGTLPAAAVTWKDEMGSKAIPQPARITVLSLPVGLQARPTRGARAVALSLRNQLLACWKVTGPCEPLMGRL